MKANEEVSTSKTDLKKSQDRLKHAQGEIRKKQAELKKTESAYNKDKVGWERNGREKDRIVHVVLKFSSLDVFESHRLE